MQPVPPPSMPPMLVPAESVFDLWAAAAAARHGGPVSGGFTQAPGQEPVMPPPTYPALGAFPNVAQFQGIRGGLRTQEL